MALLVSFTAFNSCQQQDFKSKDALASIKFTADNYGQSLLKGGDEGIPTCVDEQPDHVYVLIEDALSQQTEYNLDILEQLDDGRLTAMLKLEAGKYKVIKFEVRSANDDILWASPTENSYYDNLFNFANNVVVEFTIKPFEKISTEIDVLCWHDYDYTNFGYTNFKYHEYEIKTVCFFGDICTKFYDEWHSKYYEGNPYIQQAYSTYDFNAIFSVDIYSSSNPSEILNDTLINSNAEWLGIGQPLCVEYLDDKLIDNETFYAHIILKLPDGSDLDIATIEFTEDQWSGHGWGGDDGVFDFIIGGEDCIYNNDFDANYILTWIPLPDEVEFTLKHSSDSYFAAQFTSVTGLEISEFTVGNKVDAWCGNDTVSIKYDHNYKAKVYSIYDIPTGSFYSNIDEPKQAALNWIANEIIGSGAYGMSTIQKAIWYILGYADGENNAVAQQALAVTSYNPPIGGYIFVLLDPYYDNTLGTTNELGHYQLLLIRYDP